MGTMTKAAGILLVAILGVARATSPSHVFIDEDMIGMPEIKGKGIFDLLEWPEDKEAEPSFLQMGDDPQKVSPKKLECNCRFVRQAAPVHPDVVAAAKQTGGIQDRGTGASFKETAVEVHNVPHHEQREEDREEDLRNDREMRFQEERDEDRDYDRDYDRDDRRSMRIEDDREEDRREDDRDYDRRDD